MMFSIGKKTFLLFSIFAFLLPINAQKVLKPDANKYTGYLFTYFTGNSTDGQQLRYALSRNGYDFTPLNDGNLIMSSDTLAVNKAIRDPHILRCKDKWFRMVMTDMDMSKGKWTARGIVMLRSRDMVHWEHHKVWFPDRYMGKDYAQANAVWAPQTIYDEKVGKYMVYFSLHSNDKAYLDSLSGKLKKGGPFPIDAVYYAYANDDFSDLENDPQPLFKYDGPTIDTDIVKDANGQYHLFFNTWGGEFKGTGRKEYVFTDLHDQSSWQLLPGRIQPTANNSEGSCVYPLNDGSWMMVYDCFKDGVCQFCKSDDLEHFTLVHETHTTGSFTPRHGTVLPITEEEYTKLLNAFPNKNN